MGCCMRRMLCAFGFHKRSCRQVVERHNRLWSTCEYCGTGLVQNHRRIWITVKKDSRGGNSAHHRRASRLSVWIGISITLAMAGLVIMLMM